ncbi:TPA: hypothetical protein N0F65_007734 [Lagenidium giganteum]|uniref:Ricin B lectin domain-containing protein n=1 Tax=Lagenidium giganteum TaxID=4803 RepID=A0AAV2Z7I2_9STRA|nr:TPA: hypothetical protein N0F65_007734 [Lagenidium giganteum]
MAKKTQRKSTTDASALTASSSASASSSRSAHAPAATTAYGTTTLVSDENLHASAARRRAYVKYGLAALATGGVIAAVAFGLSGGDHAGAGVATTQSSAPAGATAPQSGAAISCLQSSYVNNETKMMEKIEGLRWAVTNNAAVLPRKTSKSSIKVDPSRVYQEIYGFGGAFTEAAALQFAKLPAEKQEEVLKLYFSREHGSGYTFGRVPMGSCDFSVSSYSFDDVANDTSLSHFDTSVEHDTKVLIPFIKRALEKNPNLKLFLAPWSPPAWMKQADLNSKYVPSMLGSATPVGLDSEFREAWANYFSKFITAYKNHGVPFWGLTPQNEPEFAAPWEACAYTPQYQAEFVGKFLGPVIRRDHPELKIMIFDHNRGSVLQWAQTVYNHPEASKYVDGMAFHWYDNERIMDGVEFHERLNDTHYVDEGRFMLATESCNCPGVAHGQDAWFRAQRYAHDILTDFNNWVVGWVDWNLLLDHTGGPNHLGNNCDAPIILDESGKDYFLQPMYHFIQHFSKYVPPGSRRIHTDVAVTFNKPGDAQLYVQYPAALHSCDNSSRQAIHRTDDNKLQVTGTVFCLDLVPIDWEGWQVILVKCIYTAQTWTFEDSGNVRMKDQCLALNHGSTQNGARIVTENCTDASATSDHQRWHFANGHLRSRASDKCVTAGYSFVQAASFVTPENNTVLVVLNENTEDAEFELEYNGATTKATIPKGAIQTYEWAS